MTRSTRRPAPGAGPISTACPGTTARSLAAKTSSCSNQWRAEMRTHKSQLSAKTEIAIESQGLAVFRQRMPNLDHQPASALLELAIGLDGSLRYFRDRESSG